MFIELTPQEIYEKLGTVTLIDIRELHEWNAYRIKNAVWLPLSEFNIKALSSFCESNIIFYCAGGVRSTKLAKRLLESGFETVVHMKGGIDAWDDAGLPLDDDLVSGGSHI